jgi:LacI family transcriptional regulator
MSKRVTIMDVARAASVNYSTVSLALRGDTRIKPVTRERIQATAKQLGYMPNHLARALSGGATRVIGVMLTEMSRYFTEPLDLIQTVGEKLGYTLSVHFCSWNQERERLGLQKFSESRVEGVIWAPSEWSGDSFLEAGNELNEHGIPCVMLGLSEENKPVFCHQVGVHKEESIRLGVEYLVQKGHHDIALATASKLPGMYGGMHRLRLPAFLSVLSEMGIPLKESNVLETLDHDHGGVEIAIELSRRPRDQWPTAIFATDDMLARGLAKGFAALGIQIPDDISLIGFDVVQDNSLAFPKLTNISLESQEVAARSIELLLEILQEKTPPKPHQVIVVPPKLIEGSSCSVRK